MRVAPISFLIQKSPEEVFLLASEAAALTHGHPSGYLSAGAFAFMIHGLITGGDLATLARQAATHAEGWLGGGETARAILTALHLGEHPSDHPELDIAKLGLGWVGEEALAIALYAALVGKNGSDVLAIAANHDGDSDSTAAIAGNLIGARDGLSCLPLDWLKRLDVFDPLCETLPGLIRVALPSR